jgi:AraC-like DNA-binding protein
MGRMFACVAHRRRNVRRCGGILRTAEVRVLGGTEHRLGQERTDRSGRTGHAAVWHWSTEQIAPRDRVSHWHDVHAYAIARRTITVDVEEFGDVDVRLWRLGTKGDQVAIQRMRIGSPSVATRTTSLLQDGNDDVILHLQLSGPRLLRQLGREAEAPEGAAVFSWNAEKSTIVLPQAAAFFSIALPQRHLRSLVPGFADRVACAVPADHAVLGLLRRYIGLVETGPHVHDPVVGQAMGRHILDLAAHLLGTARQARERGATSGLRAARLHALKEDIASNLTADVSATALARRHQVSPRYIHKLFEAEGTTVSQYVLGLRLEAVWRRLVDPGQRDRTIAEIVYAAGFGDISTFNRAFRVRFGMTPRDARRRD